jgi:hypothetical protein
MINRLGKILFCFLVALAVGVVSCVVVDAALSRWPYPYEFWNHVLIDVLLVVAVPLCVLALIAIFRSTLSTFLAVIVAVGWLTMLFAWSTYETWANYGQFFWPNFWWHYFGRLPVALSFGLAFGNCARYSGS